MYSHTSVFIVFVVSFTTCLNCVGMDKLKCVCIAAKGWLTRSCKNLDKRVALGKNDCDPFELETALHDFDERLAKLDEA